MLNQKSAVVYFSNLDSFRAIAAFLVIFYHIDLHLNFAPDSNFHFILNILSFNGQGGSLGVTFFFTLSGFLITYLMFVEYDKTGQFSIPGFYMRRVLRIWPLYYLTLITGFIIFPAIISLSGNDVETNANAWLYILFLTNFDSIYNINEVPGLLGVQWSVAIEEQFYLIWPLLFTFSNKRFFPFLLILLTLASEIYFAMATDWKLRYYHTFCNIRYLSAGAFLASIAFQFPSLIKKIFLSIPKALNLIIYLSGLLLIFFSKNIGDIFHFYNFMSHFIMLGFFLYVIAEQTFSENRLFNLGASKWLTGLGKISYGLYLIHMIVITAVVYIFGNSGSLLLIQILLVIALTIMISHISYRYFESYFLRLKGRFSSVKSGRL